MKVRPRSAVSDAVRWWPDCENADVCQGCLPGETLAPHVHIPFGTAPIQPGDWIITGPTGSKMVLSPESFEHAFEEA